MKTRLHAHLFVALALTLAALVLTGPVQAVVAATPPLPNCTSPAGDYDLSALAAWGPLTYTDPLEPNNATYAVAVCGVADREPTCTRAHGAVCEYNSTVPSAASFAHLLATFDGTGEWDNCTDPVACPHGGVTVGFANGAPCGAEGDGPPREVNYLVACDATVTGAPVAFTVTLSPDNHCWYDVALTHAAGCPVGSLPPPPNDDGGDGHGPLSVGSLFLIVLAVFVAVYVVGGCIYNRHQHGATGCDACPNAAFWRSVPALVADGCRYAYGQCLRLCGRGGDVSYANVK